PSDEVYNDHIGAAMDEDHEYMLAQIRALANEMGFNRGSAGVRRRLRRDGLELEAMKSPFTRVVNSLFDVINIFNIVSPTYCPDYDLNELRAFREQLMECLFGFATSGLLQSSFTSDVSDVPVSRTLSSLRTALNSIDSSALNPGTA